MSRQPRRELPCPTRQRLSAAQLSALTDARINIVYNALQMTPDQEKYWPAVDEIRTRAKNRQTRIANVLARVAELHERGPIEVLRERNPVDFLHRRADSLAQRRRRSRQEDLRQERLIHAQAPKGALHRTEERLRQARLRLRQHDLVEGRRRRQAHLAAGQVSTAPRLGEEGVNSRE
jgi:hypothetical protein